MTSSISLSILPSLQEISINFISSSSHNAVNLLSYSIGICHKEVFKRYILIHRNQDNYLSTQFIKTKVKYS